MAVLDRHTSAVVRAAGRDCGDMPGPAAISTPVPGRLSATCRRVTNTLVAVGTSGVPVPRLPLPLLRRSSPPRRRARHVHEAVIHHRAHSRRKCARSARSVRRPRRCASSPSCNRGRHASRGTALVSVAVEDVRQGDVVSVRPGERPPADGESWTGRAPWTSRCSPASGARCQSPSATGRWRDAQRTGAFRYRATTSAPTASSPNR
jgi:hypothetical protein